MKAFKVLKVIGNLIALFVSLVCVAICVVYVIYQPKFQQLSTKKVINGITSKWQGNSAIQR